MCIYHKWGEWHEILRNKYPYVLPKQEERECLKCHKTERRDMPSLEKRIFTYYKEGVERGDIEKVLSTLMSDYGKMRYEYITRELIKDLIESRG